MLLWLMDDTFPYTIPLSFVAFPSTVAVVRVCDLFLLYS